MFKGLRGLRQFTTIGAMLLVLVAVRGQARAGEWFVASDGKADNAGTQQTPWDITSALAAGHKDVKGGDTIWIMGGTYESPAELKVLLQGEKEKPIVVRNYKNQRVTLRAPLDIASKEKVPAKYVWVWGLEIQSLGGKAPGNPINIGNSQHEAGYNPGIKIINCVAHDNPDNGLGCWGSAEEEVYGCLVYNNGSDGDLNNPTARGHGHGFYIQSKTHKEFIDNIVFRQCFLGYQIYGSGAARMVNVTMQGNTFFNNGEMSVIQRRLKAWPQMHIGGGSPIVSPKIIENFVYVPADIDKGTCNIGGSQNALIQGNYIVSPGPDKRVAWDAETLGKNPDMKMMDNTFIGMIVGFKIDEFGNGNVHIPERPTSGRKIFVRPNKYEPGRAHITIFNWDKSPKVEVDLKTAGLKDGEAYEIRDVQDFYGKPVVTGKYDGKAVVVPMTGLTVAAPIGRDPKLYHTPPHTAPEFGVFVVMKAAEK